VDLPEAIPPVSPTRNISVARPQPPELSRKRGIDGIAHQHGDGQRADSARHRSDRSGNARDIRMHVADKRGSLFAERGQPLRKMREEIFRPRGIADAIDAHVNHRRARTHKIRRHHSRAAQRRHHDVCAANYFRQIARLRMANRHGSVRVHQQQRHRLAHNIAASQHRGVRAFQRNRAAPENLHHAGRGASHQCRPPSRQVPHIDRMKPVHIFRRIHRIENFLRIHLRRQGKLHQDAIHIIPTIQIFHNREQLRRRNRGRRRDLNTRKS
jgi:hypothetical protein